MIQDEWYDDFEFVNMIFINNGYPLYEAEIKSTAQFNKILYNTKTFFNENIFIFLRNKHNGERPFDIIYDLKTKKLVSHNSLKYRNSEEDTKKFEQLFEIGSDWDVLRSIYNVHIDWDPSLVKNKPSLGIGRFVSGFKNFVNLARGKDPSYRKE